MRTKIFMILEICFKVYIFRCYTSEKDEDQIMNDLEVETNNYKW